MSVVSNVVVFILGEEDEDPKMLAALNAFFDRPGSTANGQRLQQIPPECLSGGHKMFERSVFAGGINFLREDEFLAFARTIDWKALDAMTVEIAIAGQDDDWFRLERIYSD